MPPPQQSARAELRPPTWRAGVPRRGIARGRMSSSQPRRTPTALHPRFNDIERTELATTHGLTKAQLMWLERHLGVILDILGPHDRMEDVRVALRALDADIARANRTIQQWLGATRPAPGAEALGRLNIVSATWAEPRPEDGTWPEVVVASELIQLLARITRAAAAGLDTAVRRPPHRAAPRAIETILERLNRPTDGESQKAAAALEPTSTEPSPRSRRRPNFRQVADIVFAACYRALNTHRGSPDGPIPSAESSIRAYLVQLPASKRRARGRPRKEPAAG